MSGAVDEAQRDPMSAGFSGGCFCGRIAYRVGAAPIFVYLCHCSDCRRINGSAFHTGIAVRRDDFTTAAGEPASFATSADSGHTITRHFCRECSTQLWSLTTADLSVLSVKAGSVVSVPAGSITPRLQIFHDSRVPWAEPPRNILTYRRGMRGAEPVAP